MFLGAFFLVFVKRIAVGEVVASTVRAVDRMIANVVLRRDVEHEVLAHAHLLEADETGEHLKLPERSPLEFAQLQQWAYTCELSCSGGVRHSGDCRWRIRG